MGKITSEKIREYTWCDGDIDGYSRSGRWKKGIITDEEWSFIDRMISQIGIIRKGLASDSFAQAHEKEIENFDSLETYKLLQAFEREELTRRGR